ncbi:valine--tRNA ligase [Candidatus Pacearchaeota archaeon]|nr:valine--tRNA ligase [Candidatus Pacearchaeota archaeon]|tara:strand:+ start:10791 stop:13145 length:2355 start_codon:yes stop_codon:yes gene_type:complete
MSKPERKKPQIDIHEIESRWLSYWEKGKTYSFDPKSKKKTYSIDTPPPYISGQMHIGHAFSYSQEDFIARYKRMAGFNVFYPFGTDDNGLPTERWIEKTKGIKSKDMSRNEFIKIGLALLKEKTPELIQDWKNIGISADYNVSYSTIDDNTRKISQKSFLDLYASKLIYKENFPTIYCPECQTPVAQAELEDKSLSSQFSTLKFKSSGKNLPIATTRPELLGACVAVFVNPKDKRYKEFIGKKATVPLFKHSVPILADESAEIEKGTGVLMVCSYGDKYDVDAINRHKLTPKVVFNLDGTLNSKEYKGLTIKQARSKILEDLESKKLIIEQKPINHVVNVHDKCGTEIEFLPTEQWFIKILDKKTKLIAQGKKVTWHPQHMFKRYENWIKGLEWDWSISRERHFGIPIPVWECPKCNLVIPAKLSELPIDPTETPKKCSKCNCQAIGDTKVLDTWATSSLTPQIAASLIKSKIKIPYSLRPQGHDIIRTWAFYTIVKSLYHENQIPWQDIIVSGFVTLGGKAMSKSKGTGISPRSVMAEYGSDALRFWAASSKLGEDLDYNEADLIAGKKFITKILNASNFVFMNLKYQSKMPKLIETDRIFLSQLNKLISSCTEAFNEYNYSKAKLETEKFFWQVFADYYLEIVKNRVYQGSDEEKASAFYTLYHSLLTILKLSAPITPFITEEIYQNHFKSFESVDSIHISDWPKPIPIATHRHDDKIWEKMTEIIYKVRQAKSMAKQPMNVPISLSLIKSEQSLLSGVLPDLRAVTTAKELETRKLSIKFL